MMMGVFSDISASDDRLWPETRASFAAYEPFFVVSRVSRDPWSELALVRGEHLVAIIEGSRTPPRCTACQLASFD